jgi:hypothetical protein
MPFDKHLADRVRRVIAQTGTTEKKMFGGLVFLVEGNICVGLWHESLIARVGPEAYQAALDRPHVKEFDVTGRPMRGWVLIQSAGLTTDLDLDYWVDLSLDYVLTLPAKDE